VRVCPEALMICCSNGNFEINVPLPVNELITYREILSGAIILFDAVSVEFRFILSHYVDGKRFAFSQFVNLS